MDQNAPGGPGDPGATWQNAYIYLQDALAYAAANPEIDEVWVAAGTYYPDQDAGNPDGTGLRESTFLLDFNNVQLLGGFFGTETLPEQRDPVANITVLSGDITFPLEDVCGPGNGDCFEPHDNPGCEDAACCDLVCQMDPFCCIDPWSQNCATIANNNCTGGELPYGAYHVVTALNVDETVRIDGFTITLGSAAGGGPNSRGGGVFIDDASPAVIRCVITGNAAGGGDGEGGGMHITGTSNVTIVNCTFRENLAIEGGGLHLDLGVASATLVNCLFHDNDAIDHGGAIDVGSDDPAFFDVINCTFVNNSAGDQQGGAIFVEDPECPADSGPMVLITNSILWFNTPDQIEQIGGDITVRFSNVQGGVEIGWDGGDNIDEVPIFGPGIDNFRLAAGSRGIDEGNNADVPCDAFDVDHNGEGCFPLALQDTPDLDLGVRIVDGNEDLIADVDMGAYESVPCPWDLDGNCVVGVSDFLALLYAWGPCPPMGECPADFNNSGDVGVSDFLDLLANWGPCSCAPQATVLSLPEELADACLTEDHWEDFEDVMTDPDRSQADKDRYNCWMIHLLDHCNNCTCTHKSECPNPNPFT